MQKDDHPGSIITSRSTHSWWTRALLVLAPVFFVVDQWCKSQVMRAESSLSHLVGAVGIEPLHNTRLFIWIPVPSWLLLVLTSVVFFAATALLVLTRGRRSAVQTVALSWILWGGASNLIDRIRFDATIDYLRIGGIVANIADFLIIAGILMLLLWPHTSSNSDHTNLLPTKNS